MADFIYNLLLLGHEDEELLKRIEYTFTDVHGDSRCLSLPKIVPQPPELLFKQEKGSMNTDLYDWRCENWGTKWDVTNDIHVKDPAPSRMYFMSAWNAPIPAIKQLSKICTGVKMRLYSATESPGNGAVHVDFLDGKIMARNVYETEHDILRVYLLTCNDTVDDYDRIVIGDDNKLRYEDDED